MNAGRVVAPQMGALYVSGRCKPSTCFLHGQVTVRALSGRADYQLCVRTQWRQKAGTQPSSQEGGHSSHDEAPPALV